MYKIKSVIFLLSLHYIISVKSDDEGKLEIHNTFKPDSCNRKAKVTDILTLHYKGALQNGQEFDSR